MNQEENRYKIFRRSFYAVFLAGFCFVWISWTAANAHASGFSLERETAPTVLDEIEGSFLSGRINNEERVYYRLAAVKAPHLLPARWREIAALRGLPPGRSYTSIFVEAAQTMLNPKGVLRYEIEQLLQPPSGYEYVIEVDEPLPFRVFYNHVIHESRAEAVAEAMIVSHVKQVEEWGFWPPPIDPDLGAYHVYIDNTGMGGGAYTAPYAIVDENPWADMYSYIVVDSSIGMWSIPGTTAHEYNHACQAAMDVLEPVAFWENTATYIMSQVYSSAWNYTMGVFSFFQSRPYRPLEYMARPTDMYEYGGGLWVYFMSYLYGNEDPRWIREVWEGSVQESYYWNYPHYFGVLDEMLQDWGGFQEMVKTFSEYRYFAGQDDDGQHLPGAGYWWEAAVAKEAEYRTSDLPVHNKRPSNMTRPQQNGCNYIDLNLYGVNMPILFGFDGEEDKEWFVQIMGIEPGKPTIYEEMHLDEENAGELEIDPGSIKRLVMVVCHMGGENYDPNLAGQWEGGDYEYSIIMFAPEPTVTDFYPATAEPGSQGEFVTVLGQGFVDGQDLEVRISGEGAVVYDLKFISNSQLEGRLVVASSVESGLRDVFVSNPGGREGRGENLFEIIDPAGDIDAGTSTGGKGRGGCGCRIQNPVSSEGTSLPVLFAILAFVFIKRRR